MDQKEALHLGGSTDLQKLNIALYIKLEVGQTPKGEVEKNYLVCYPALGKKETSCKEIG